MALTTPTTPRSDPARARGLRRHRDLMAAMPDVDTTPLPAPVEAVHVLALVLRERAERCAAGKLQSGRAHPRPFKALIAELGYLRRLAAAGEHGGTVLTSMGQLVHGFAKFNVAWDTTGDWWEVRDHYQSSVRAHLRLLSTLGLIRVQVGVDLDGEERRTEITLLDAPAVTVEELQRAAETLQAWSDRLGAELNTTARKRAVVNAVSHSRPLTASEIQRRGCLQTRQRAACQAARERSEDVSAPPCGTSASLRKNGNGGPTAPFSLNELTANAPDDLDVSGTRTGVHTRTSADDPSTGAAALNWTSVDETAGIEEGSRSAGGRMGSQDATESPAEGASAAVWDPEALVARVKAAQAQRAPVLARIAEQAQRRSLEVAGWSLDREWPAIRLREAWVVARWGASTAADSGPSTAGPLSREHYVRLRRAVARWERNASAVPDGWPSGGLAALLHLGTLGALGELHDAPRLLGYAIGRLDQLSRRLRAVATANSAVHQAWAGQRAHRRREVPTKPPTPGTLTFTFRGQPAVRAVWPPLLLLEGRSEPVFSPTGELLLNRRLIDAGLLENPSLSTRLAIRDAYLLAGRQLPLHVDGRAIMAARYRGQIEPAARRQPFSLQDAELRELAHLTNAPIALLRRLSVDHRTRWLHDQRVAAAQRTAAETAQLKAQLAERRSAAPSPATAGGDEIQRINAQLAARRRRPGR